MSVNQRRTPSWPQYRSGPDAAGNRVCSMLGSETATNASIASRSPERAASMNSRTISTFSRDIGYSDIPTASRASASVAKAPHQTTFLSRHRMATQFVSSSGLSLSRRGRWCASW